MLLLLLGATVTLCLPQCVVPNRTAGPTAAPVCACEIQLCTNSSEGSGRAGSAPSLPGAPAESAQRNPPISSERGHQEPTERGAARGAARGAEELAQRWGGAWSQRSP